MGLGFSFENFKTIQLISIYFFQSGRDVTVIYLCKQTLTKAGLQTNRFLKTDF